MVLVCVSATPLVEVAAGMWLSSSGWSMRIRSFCEIGWWSEWTGETGFVEQNRRKRDEVGLKMLLLWSAWSAIVASLSTYIIRLRMRAESPSEMVVDNDVDVLSAGLVFGPSAVTRTSLVQPLGIVRSQICRMGHPPSQASRILLPAVTRRVTRLAHSTMSGRRSISDSPVAEPSIEKPRAPQD